MMASVKGPGFIVTGEMLDASQGRGNYHNLIFKARPHDM